MGEKGRVRQARRERDSLSGRRGGRGNLNRMLVWTGVGVLQRQTSTRYPLSSLHTHTHACTRGHTHTCTPPQSVGCRKPPGVPWGLTQIQNFRGGMDRGEPTQFSFIQVQCGKEASAKAARIGPAPLPHTLPHWGTHRGAQELAGAPGTPPRTLVAGARLVPARLPDSAAEVGTLLGQGARGTL